MKKLQIQFETLIVKAIEKLREKTSQSLTEFQKLMEKSRWSEFQKWIQKLKKRLLVKKFQ